MLLKVNPTRRLKKYQTLYISQEKILFPTILQFFLKNKACQSRNKNEVFCKFKSSCEGVIRERIYGYIKHYSVNMKVVAYYMFISHAKTRVFVDKNEFKLIFERKNILDENRMFLSSNCSIKEEDSNKVNEMICQFNLYFLQKLGCAYRKFIFLSTKNV